MGFKRQKSQHERIIETLNKNKHQKTGAVGKSQKERKNNNYRSEIW